MNKKSSSVIVLLVVLAIAISMFMGVRNELMSLKEDADMQKAQVETVLQRRSDLIPNLVATVKGYMAHEEAIFTEIAEAREGLTKSLESGDVTDINDASSTLDSALSRLIAISENYPDLKSSEHFIALMDELAGTENRIAVARQYYNEKVMAYNKAVQAFPTSIAAKIMGYYPLPYFNADVGAKTAPSVSFN